MKYLKFAVFGFNLLIWLSGGLVLVSGAWLLLEPSNGHLLNLFVENATPEETVPIVAYSLLSLSSIIFIVAIFGCRASMHGNQCILGMYTSMLIIVITTELAVMAVGGFMTYRTLSRLEVRLRSRLTEYGHDSTSDKPFSHSLDFAQYKFNCCGIQDDSDYNGTAWWRDGQYSGARRQVPLTCCVLKEPEKNAGSPMSVVTRVFHKDVSKENPPINWSLPEDIEQEIKLLFQNEKPWLRPQPRDELACQVSDPEGHRGFRHKQGCLDKMTEWLRAESTKLVLLALMIAAFQTFGVISSALLCRSIRVVQQD